MGFAVMHGPAWWIVVDEAGKPVAKARILSAKTATGEIAALHEGAEQSKASTFDIEVDGVRYDQVPLRQG